MLIRRRRYREVRAHTVIQVPPLGLHFNHKVAFVFVSALFERVGTVAHCGSTDQTNVIEISASFREPLGSRFISLGLLLTLENTEIQSVTYLLGVFFVFFFHSLVLKTNETVRTDERGRTNNSIARREHTEHHLDLH